MLPNNPPNFKGVEYTNTCCVCSKQFKDNLFGGYNNTKISPTCSCGIVNDNLCSACKNKKDLKCPKCNSPVQLINVLY